MSADRMLDGLTLISIKSHQIPFFQHQSTQTPPPRHKKFNLLPIINDSSIRSKNFKRRKSHSPDLHLLKKTRNPTVPNLNQNSRLFSIRSKLPLPKLKKNLTPIRLDPWLESVKLLNRLPR